MTARVAEKRDETGYISLEKVQTHNLEGIDCKIPRGAFTVISGVSGSGKSSLAFDTLHAEGQRRYTESLSTYARQFLRQMKRPPVDGVHNIPPSLALRQKNDVSRARSTVSTITELDDFLQLVYAAIGTTYCPECGSEVSRATVPDTVEAIADELEGERVVITARIDVPDPNYRDAFLKHLVQEGYRRLYLDGTTTDLTSIDIEELLDAPSFPVIIDRLEVDSDDKMRLAEAVESGFRLGEGVIEIHRHDAPEAEPVVFDESFRCNECQAALIEPQPALFSFNGSLGACDECSGFGKVTGVDRQKVIPNEQLSIEDGVVTCFESSKFRNYKRRLIRACRDQNIAVDIPFCELPEEARDFVWYGGHDWPGVEGFFDHLRGKRYKKHVRIFIARYRGYSECPKCKGQRLNKHARQVKVAGKSVSDIWAMRISEAVDFFDDLELTDRQREQVLEPLTEIRDRLRYLDTIGVGYLTLDRQTRTLSGGEMQRIHLTTSLGRALTETLYVLDEPTAGMHARDTERLVSVIRELRNLGNTVVVVEHDPDVIEAADYVIELGPGGGKRGGQILFQGPASEFEGKDTLTSRSLDARRKIEPNDDFEAPDDWIEINGAREYNLKRLEVGFPHRRLTAVTGVSGSGKSTLCEQILYKGLKQQRGEGGTAAGQFDSIEGADHFDDVVLMDQAALSRSTRSNALSYSGAFGQVRKLFSKTKAAQLAGLTKSHFSFNTKGGRCEACDGKGVQTVEMHFMADIDVECEECQGKRYTPRVLGVQYRGKNIDDVLNMTVDEAVEFFSHRTPITRRLEPLQAVGLGYISLGQTTATLSGGEAQRLKLASYVAEGRSRSSTKPSLFIFDEPTIGLHLLDIDTLLTALNTLVDLGHTVIVIEHNLDFVAQCDYVVDLGPGAGPRGGAVVAEGSPAEVAQSDSGFTARHLVESFPAVTSE